MLKAKACFSSPQAQEKSGFYSFKGENTFFARRRREKIWFVDNVKGKKTHFLLSAGAKKKWAQKNPNKHWNIGTQNPEISTGSRIRWAEIC